MTWCTIRRGRSRAVSEQAIRNASIEFSEKSAANRMVRSDGIGQGRTQGFCQQLEPVHHADRCQHMGRVGPLPAPGLDQPRRLALLQQFLEQPLPGLTRKQSGAELAENGEVEARVGQLETEQVFPVDPGADGVGGPSIRESLAELQDGDEGEPPGGEGGLPTLGVEVGEVLVAEDGSQLITEPEIGVSFGECGTGDECGQLGDGRDRAGLQGHGGTSGWSAMATWCILLQYTGLPP